jgi:DNA-binding transcriptional MerR regulator
MSGGVGSGAAADGPALTVAAVARRLGVAPATLRTWDRRYGLGPTARTSGSHRRYTARDLERLDVMSRLTREGVRPAEAARIALQGEASAAAIDGSAGQARPETPEPARAIPLRDTDAAVRGLVKAAQALDAQAIDRTVVAALRDHGVVWTWDALLVPALTAVGDKWGATGSGVDVEHLLADGILRGLCGVSHAVPEPRNARPVLLACAPEELHSLPLYALAAALGERGIDARVLGPRVPPDALAAAVRRAGACAVFIWAHDTDRANLEQVGAVPSMRPPVTVVVGGPGWEPGAPQFHATCVQQFSQAVTVLQRAAVG